MSDAANWATAIRAADVLLHGRSISPVADDARIIVERVTGQVMILAGPAEVFSQRMQAYTPAPGESDLAPIDVLYGHYDPERLLIECFIRRISDDARLYGAEVNDLLTIVRLHEYAHAVFHTGVHIRCVETQLGTFGAGDTTDWGPFRAARDQAFASLDESSHELLAQAITWACLCHESLQAWSDRLTETFLALEAKQPSRYRLPSKVKLRASSADWPLVLRAMRQEARVHQDSGFRMTESLAELIVQTGAPEITDDLPSDDPLVPNVSQLQQRLAVCESTSLGGSANEDASKLLIQRIGYIELRMNKEDTKHRRPHFHIEYKKEYAASYAIDSFERLAGYMPRKYESPILSWAMEKQEDLKKKWESLNGPVRCALAEGKT